MRKIFFVLSILLSSAFTFAETKGSGSYSISCKDCKEITLSGKKAGCSYCLGCPMWRCYDLEIKHFEFKYNKEKKDYLRTEVQGIKGMVYRCQHGHQIVVE